MGLYQTIACFVLLFDYNSNVDVLSQDLLLGLLVYIAWYTFPLLFTSNS